MKHSVGFVLGALVVAGCSGTATNLGFDNSNGGPNGDNSQTDDGGTAGSNGEGGTTEGGSPSKPQPPPTHLLSGLSVDEIAVFQGVKISVLKAGSKITPTLPIVAGRDGLIRLYVKPAAGWASKSATAVLSLTAADGTALPQVSSTQTISAASTDAAPNSTFNFTVPGSSLPEGVKFAVAITDSSATETAAGATSTARFPADGSLTLLGTKSSGAQLKVTLVPVQYQADGSNRMPDTSAAQVEAYRQEMIAIYPAAKVVITVRAPFPWASTISASGSGFGNILQAMVDLRQTDNAPDDVYYFGAFAPSSSFNNYCGGGCVTGLSGVNEQEDDATGRASVGVGFGGADDSAVTMAHEVGHAHGRSHAPCGGASGPDPHFPYSTGGIGVWGYNINTKVLIDPAQGKDIMGYCQPEWVSDYTYSALFDRMAFVNMAKDMVGQISTPQAYRFVNVGADGSLSFGKSTTLTRAPNAEPHAVSYAAADGSVLATATGHYYKYDHLPGGFMMIPEGPANYATVSVQGLAASATHARRTY